MASWKDISSFMGFPALLTSGLWLGLCLPRTVAARVFYLGAGCVKPIIASPVLCASHLDLPCANLVVGGVNDGAVASSCSAAHDDDDVVGFAGAAAEYLVVALALRPLGNAETDEFGLRPGGVFD